MTNCQLGWEQINFLYTMHRTDGHVEKFYKQNILFFPPEAWFLCVVLAVLELTL